MLYKFSVRYRRSLTSRTVFRMTVTARDADEARAFAKLRDPLYLASIEVKRRQEVVITPEEIVATFRLGEDFLCRFCKRLVVDGLYTRVSFPDGVANVCDNCHEKRGEDTATWRDTEVEVV